MIDFVDDEWIPVRHIIDDCLSIVSPPYQLDSIVKTFNSSVTYRLDDNKEALKPGTDLYYIRLALNLWESISLSLLPEYCTTEDKKSAKTVQIYYENLSAEKGLLGKRPVYVQKKLANKIRQMRSDQVYNPGLIDSYAFKLLQEFIEFLVNRKGESFPIRPREERQWEAMVDEKWPKPQTQEIFSNNDRTALLRYLPKTIAR